MPDFDGFWRIRADVPWNADSEVQTFDGTDFDGKELFFDGFAMYFDGKALFFDGFGCMYLETVIEGRMNPP